eukprot:7816276-Pyramimonas_sp.AAC.1
MDGWPQGPRHLCGVLRNSKGGKGKSGKGKGSVVRDGQDIPGPGADPQGHAVDDHRWETVFREDHNAHTAIGAAIPGLRQVAGKHMKSGALKLTTIGSSQGGEADI